MTSTVILQCYLNIVKVKIVLIMYYVAYVNYITNIKQDKFIEHSVWF